MQTNMSAVWKFFSVCEEDNKFAICNTCKEKVGRGGTTPKTFGTTNLIRHLRQHHSAEFAKFNEASKGQHSGAKGKQHQAQASTGASTNQQTLLALLSKEKSKGITGKIMEFIALDDQPFSEVENLGFRNLINYLSPKYVIPSRRYFSDVALKEMFDNVSKHTRSILHANPNAAISFTTDIWTSNVSLMSMLSLTAQWVDDDFQLHQVILQCQEMVGSHTAANLAFTFERMLEDWGIDRSRVHVVLRDNAKNMVKALNDANLASLPCMAHTLQLAVNEGLLSQRSIIDMVKTGRKIVGHFKHSPQAYSRFHDIQEQLGQPRKCLQQDVITRWNSTFYMLESLIEQRRALGAFATENDLPATLTMHQWGLIENVLTLLAPFEELTKEISSSTATAADVIPAITVLKRLLEKRADTDFGVGTTKATLLEAVQRRFSDVEKEPLYTLATVLDPRLVGYLLKHLFVFNI